MLSKIHLPQPYIAFDGLDGSGKSTAVKDFKKILLRDYAVNAYEAREVGGTYLAEQVRDIILDPALNLEDATTELLLIEAARRSLRNYLDDMLLLSSVPMIISDRCEASTYAYQCVAGGAPYLLFKQIEELHPVSPSLYVHLKVDPVVAMERIRARGVSDRFERSSLEFFQDVAEGYEDYFDEMDGRGAYVVTIDANGSTEDTYDQLVALAARIEF